MNKLIIMRGCPGSGKSTIAKKLYENYAKEGYESCFWLSTDSFWMTDDDPPQYKFDVSKLSQAHTNTFAAFCVVAGEAFGAKGPRLIVLDNTNTQWKEFSHYVAVAKKLKFSVEQLMPDTEWAFDAEELFKRNLHSVPLDTIKAMIGRFESYESIESKLGQ